MKHIVILLVVAVMPIVMFAQNLVTAEALKLIEGSQADVLYANEFGNFRNDELDEPFPYCVIRIDLEGDVEKAKSMLSLDVGAMFRVEAKDAFKDNMILFLVSSSVRQVYLQCGDGCKPQQLHYGTLQANKVYACKVTFKAAEEKKAEENSNAILAEMAEMKKQMEEMRKQNEQLQKNLQDNKEGDKNNGDAGVNKGNLKTTDYPGVIIENGILKRVPDDFSGEFIIGNDVTEIAENAFRSCKYLTTVKIANSVQKIGETVFCYCDNLTDVSMPNNLIEIGDFVFWRCPKITRPIYTNNCFIYLPDSYKGSYTIPSFIQSILGGAFYKCENLTSITIPNGVKFIGHKAFYGCKGLRNISIPNSVDSIGDDAFVECTGLKDVVLPQNIMNIGMGIFYNCTGITAPLFNNRTFIYMPKSYSGSYTIPSGIQIIANGAFSRCSNLSHIEIPSSVKSIGDYSFYKCAGLTNIVIPNSVTFIGIDAFGECSGLMNVTIPGSVREIKDVSFEGCTALKKVVIKSGVNIIGGRAFLDCSNLTSVEIPNSVSTIEYFAFEGCSSLRYITLPNSVMVIDNDNPFDLCDNLLYIYVPMDSKERFKKLLPKELWNKIVER